jgi:hypothetical protein
VEPPLPLPFQGLDLDISEHLCYRFSKVKGTLLERNGLYLTNHKV